MHSTTQARRQPLAGWLTLTVAATLAVSGCAGQTPAAAQRNSPAAGSAARSEAETQTQFQPYLVIDQQQGGLAMARFNIPQNWRGQSRVVWNYKAYYVPVTSRVRLEAPDGSSWVELHEMRMFVWFDPGMERQAREPWGQMGLSGAIHHPGVSPAEALLRYIIMPNRRNVKNAKVLGYRPVNNLPAIFPKLLKPGGQGVCMRVQYELDGAPVDEEFYAYMPRPDAIPGNGGTEYHSYLYMVHSFGAKSGKLESMRPLLGSIAASVRWNPAWSQRLNEVGRQLQQGVMQQTAATYEGIERAKQMSAQTHASNEAFLARSQANRAQSQAQEASRRASYNASPSQGAARGNDDFDQYLRGTEHMQDHYGVVSDQYTDYNYHWTDGFGRFAHSNDPNFDPNRVLNGNYQQMTPVR